MRVAGPGGTQGDGGTKYVVFCSSRSATPSPASLPPSHPLSASPQQELRTNPSTNVHPKADPGVPPRAPRTGWMGWAAPVPKG